MCVCVRVCVCVCVYVCVCVCARALSPSDVVCCVRTPQVVDMWVRFYVEHPTYRYVGKLRAPVDADSPIPSDTCGQ